MIGSNGSAHVKPAVVKLSDAAERRVEEVKRLYPDVRSAVMPALYMAQDELGSVTQEAIDWVAARIGISPVQVWEVATFYTMYYKKPVGKYHVQICRTLSCALMGARSLGQHVEKNIGVHPGDVSPDGMWSVDYVECLGSCGTAPMCQINDVFFENLTPEKLDEIMRRIAAEQPDLRYSTVRDELGAGLSGYPMSAVRGSGGKL